MIQIKGINHVAVTVSDLEASKRFYEDVVGLTPVDRPPLSFGGAWYSVGSQEFHLIHDPDTRFANREHHHFAVQVEDVCVALDELEAKGVVIRRGPVKRADGAVQIFFTDPDGYVIEMYSRP